MEKNGDQDCQPVLSPGTLEFVENAIQIPISYDELPAYTHGILQLLMNQLARPGASNSIDQVSPLPVAGTQWPVNPMAAGFQPLTQHQIGQPAEISTADSRSTRTIGESEISKEKQIRRDRKRANDRAYRKRETEKKQKLLEDNQEKDRRVKELDAEIERLKREMLNLMNSTQLKLTKLEAEKERLEGENHLLEGENHLLNEKLENKSREMDRLIGKMDYMEQQITKLKEQGIKKPKKKQVMMRETAEETKNDN